MYLRVDTGCQWKKLKIVQFIRFYLQENVAIKKMLLLPANAVKLLLNACTLRYIPKLFDVSSCILLAVKKIQITKTF